MTAIIEDLMAQRDALVKLAKAQQGILIAYRTRGRTPGKHIDAANEARATLAKYGIKI